MLLEGNTGTEQNVVRRKLLATMSLAGAAAGAAALITLETVYGGQDPELGLER